MFVDKGGVEEETHVLPVKFSKLTAEGDHLEFHLHWL